MHIGALAEFLRIHKLLRDERDSDTFTIYEGYKISDYEPSLRVNANYDACWKFCAASDQCVGYTYYEERRACLMSPSYTWFPKDARMKSGILKNRPQPSVR
jgi:hypothetical protein